MNRDTVVGVVGMVLLAVGWIFLPGATLLVIGGLIGLLAALAWVARRLRI